jgi:hypothetical protein
MLLFKKRFLEAIRAGEKTQTIRLWKHRRMRAGQKSYIPGAGYIRVLSVDEVRLEDLTEEDARRDGYPSAEALRTELKELYPKQLAEGHTAYRVAFQVVPKEDADEGQNTKD